MGVGGPGGQGFEPRGGGGWGWRFGGGGRGLESRERRRAATLPGVGSGPQVRVG